MKRIFTLIICTVAFGNLAFPQADCTGGRYTDYDMFSGADVTSAITFGNNASLNGTPVDLKMDVYQPTGDTETNRPVIVLAFGGSFVSGTRGDVAFLCNIFAKLGYVAVAPDYRVGLFQPNQLSTTLAVVRGAHDIKACVRFLKKSVAEEGNPYGIDCSRIIVGGISAGAIAAVHAAYLDKTSEVPSYMDGAIDGIGGIEGNSGTLEYPSDVIGVLSFSGAVGDTMWIESGDAAIVSVHEELDGTVPYLTQEVSVFNIPTGLVASGSGDLHKRANNVGLTNELKTYFGVENHVGYLNPIDQAAMDFATSFLAQVVCSGETNACSSVGISEVERNSITLYPNPTTDILNFNSEETATIEVIDATGRIVISTVSRFGQNRLDVSLLPTGVYTLRSIGKQISTAHFVKN
ncbi:MAG: T9SS type A sorting domain-containing protein [Flavobacteriales bacterium]|nr:T9SS type A sorting domain-containing protein [Flavobacteriales bacterium]